MTTKKVLGAKPGNSENCGFERRFSNGDPMPNFSDFHHTKIVAGKDVKIVIPGAVQDRFMVTWYCDRCGAFLDGRNYSYFTFEALCPTCAAKEEKAIAKLKELGIEPSVYETSGEIPAVIADMLKVDKPEGGAKKR